MRKRFLLCCSVLVAVVTAAVSLSSGPAAADQYSKQIAALQSQAYTIETQIAALQQQGSTALTQAAQAEQQLASTQASLATAQAQFDVANQRLAATTEALQTTQASLLQDRRELGLLLVAIYRMQSDGTVTAALVDSTSFLDAIDVVTSLGQVSQRMLSLVRTVHQKEQQLTALRAQREADFQSASALVTSLQTLGAQQQYEQHAFQSQAATLNGQAATLVAQLQGVQDKLDKLLVLEAQLQSGDNSGTTTVTGTALPPFAFGPRVDYFPWGQCTWYVASLRDVTWDGNAGDWAATAAAQGKPEGLTPKPGAIVVFGPGNGYSDIGHVAYVVSVQSPTSFTLDEANYLGLGVVDQRAVKNLDDVEAFIY